MDTGSLEHLRACRHGPYIGPGAFFSAGTPRRWRRFPTDANLVSWACICPRNDESAGKRRSSRIRTGSPWLKTTLVQCAWAAARTKGSYLQAQFHRIRAGGAVPKKAIVAVAASILTAIYHMLKNGTMYQDLGPNHFHRCDKEQQKKRLVQRLADLGYAVELAPFTASVSP